MSDDTPTQQVARVLRKHREELNEEGVCICGWTANREMDYPAHAAQCVADALQLTEQHNYALHKSRLVGPRVEGSTEQ